MSRNASQSKQVDYTKRSYYTALIALVAAFVGVSIAYLAWQHPKSHSEPNRLVTQEATPTPTPTPVLTPTPSPSPTSSPTPDVEAGKRKPTKKPRTNQARTDNRCYLLNEDGSYAGDEEGYRIEVDCETGEEIQP